MSAFDELLLRMVNAGGTELVIKAGGVPRARVDGNLVALAGVEHAVDADTVARLFQAVAPSDRVNDIKVSGETEFAYAIPSVGRFRVAAFRQRGSIALVCRRVTAGVPVAEEIGLPPVLDRLCGPGRGLVLVTGPAGSGTTTTLAALVDHINSTRACHVVTIEDPVEHLHVDRLAAVSQREVRTDTPSISAAVAKARRQGADVVAVGSVPDHAALHAVVEAAEHGTLVLAARPALSTTEALVRLIEEFPEAERRRIRAVVGGAIRGVLGQRLLNRADGKGSIAAFEVLLGTPKVREAIAADRLSELPQQIADGEYRGMQTLDRALMLLAQDGLISSADAIAAADNPDDLEITLRNRTP